MIFRAARRRDGSESIVLEPETWFTQPVYSCASSATKAGIKEVRFRYNATLSTGRNRKALLVVNMNARTNPGKESMPLRGIQSLELELEDLPQPWGTHLIGAGEFGQPLYLPRNAGSGLLTTAPGGENLLASNGMKDLLGGGIYQYNFGDFADYTNERHQHGDVCEVEGAFLFGSNDQDEFPT